MFVDRGILTGTMFFSEALGRTPFRCRGCRKRFYASFFYRSHSKQVVPSSTSKHSKRRVRAINRKRLGRLLVTGVVFAVAFIVFWIVLRYFMAMKNPAQDTNLVSTHETRLPS